MSKEVTSMNENDAQPDSTGRQATQARCRRMRRVLVLLLIISVAANAFFGWQAVRRILREPSGDVRLPYMGSGLSAVKVFNPPKGPFEKYALILVSEDQRLRSEQIVRQEELVGMLGDRPEGYIPEEFLIVWAAGRYPELRFWLTMHTSNFGMDSPVSRAVRVGPAGKLKPGQGLWGYERDETTRWVGNEIELGKLTWFTEDDNKRTTRIVLRALREGDPVPPLAEILYVDTLRTGR